MKKAIFCIFVLFVISMGLFAQQLTVAVSPFEARGGLSQSDAESVTELFVAELVANRTIQVVDRANFDKIMAEMRFQASDWADSYKVGELGRMTGANSIIRGTVVSLGGEIVITATVLDINTAQILSSSVLRMRRINEVFDKLPEFVANMIKNLPNNPSSPIPAQSGTYKIGDTGPGGGIIFFAEGNSYKECSGDLGSYGWDDAIRVAQNHRGGRFNNWRLPSQEDLELMYNNLKLKGLGGFSGWYWSSSRVQVSPQFNPVWVLNFNNGDEGHVDPYPSNRNLVRAVRDFSP
jgi:TolB-like protein